MRERLSYYGWTCDDCGEEARTPTWEYPDGWEEVDDNPEGECRDVCAECVKNHSIT